MALLHISRRTRILLLFPPIFLMSLVCLGFLILVISVTFFSEPTEVVPFVVKPGADGKLAFPGPTYQFRVWPTEFEAAWRYSNRNIPFVVSLSIDRRKLGSLEAPSERQPIIVCGAYGCNIVCPGSRPCDDKIGNGWYIVNVVPVDVEFGNDPSSLRLGPEAGTGIRCGDTNKDGLQLCWDPVHNTPSEPVANVRSVSYEPVEGSTSDFWVSTAKDTAGHPTFVARCAVKECRGSIERYGARLDITFSSRELDNWQRFDSGLHDFALRLIEPLSNTSDDNR